MGSRGVFQPVGQKRLTNIAVVRLKKGGTRFEIACYRNKVQDWRSGIEKDLDEVLQTTAVFLNVSKGVLAKDKELQLAFGTTDLQAICLEVLAKGELQVAEQERKVKLGNLFKDVASVLAEKCVNPESGRPYTPALIERALRDVHFNVDPKKSAKQQALEVIPVLQKSFPIVRARIRLSLTVPLDFKDELERILEEGGAENEASDIQHDFAIFTTVVDPGLFRVLHNFMVATTNNRGRVDLAVFVHEGTNARALVPTPPLAAASASGGTHAPTTTQTAAAGDAAVAASSMQGMHIREQGASDSSSAGSQQQANLAAGRSVARGREEAVEVLYPRGSISGLPEEHASRRERFAELDTLQVGWQVELRKKGEAVEAVFFPPGSDTCVGAYAVARRQALAASKGLS